MKKFLVFAAVAVSLILVAGCALANDISGPWVVSLHGYNYFTDKTPARVPVMQTKTDRKSTL